VCLALDDYHAEFMNDIKRKVQYIVLTYNHIHLELPQYMATKPLELTQN